MGEEKQKPLTREDVLRLIEENGGTAEELDLSGKVFEEGIDLSGLELEGIVLKDARFPTHFEGQKLVGAKFNGSDLNRADFRNVNLQYAQFGMLNKQPTRLEGADLRGTILLNANFQGAELSCAKFGRIEDENFRPATLENTDFRNACLFRTNFIGCHFYGTKLEGAYIRGADITIDTHLGEADWGSYKIGEEIGEGIRKDLSNAEHRYRQLKAWYTHSGYEHIASKFHYREIEARRKGLKLFSKSSIHRIALQFSYWVFGHGEGWKRILPWMAGVISIFALIYFILGTLTPNSFLNSLYYSAVSFTALGYGSWAPQPTGWVKWLGAVEAIVGVSMMALLLVTFVRKWTR